MIVNKYRKKIGKFWFGNQEVIQIWCEKILEMAIKIKATEQETLLSCSFKVKLESALKKSLRDFILKWIQ